jgi:hypothetical protein
MVNKWVKGDLSQLQVTIIDPEGDENLTFSYSPFDMPSAFRVVELGDGLEIEFRYPDTSEKKKTIPLAEGLWAKIGRYSERLYSLVTRPGRQHFTAIEIINSVQAQLVKEPKPSPRRTPSDNYRTVVKLLDTHINDFQKQLSSV